MVCPLRDHMEVEAVIDEEEDCVWNVQGSIDSANLGDFFAE